MTIRAYLDCLATIPVPSVEQTDQFARSVRTAHSWYKRLPPTKPGWFFSFLLDPFRGTNNSLRPKEDDDNMLRQFGHWCFYVNTEDEPITMNGIVVPQDIVNACSHRFTASLFDDGQVSSPRSWHGVLKRRIGGGINDEELGTLLAEAGRELDDALFVALKLFQRYCVGSR